MRTEHRHPKHGSYIAYNQDQPDGKVKCTGMIIASRFDKDQAIEDFFGPGAQAMVMYTVPGTQIASWRIF